MEKDKTFGELHPEIQDELMKEDEEDRVTMTDEEMREGLPESEQRIMDYEDLLDREDD